MIIHSCGAQTIALLLKLDRRSGPSHEREISGIDLGRPAIRNVARRRLLQASS